MGDAAPISSIEHVSSEMHNNHAMSCMVFGINWVADTAGLLLGNTAGRINGQIDI